MGDILSDGETIYENESLKEVIESHLEQERGETEGRDYFYVSELSKKCKWYLWHSLNGTEKDDLSANDNLTFTQGSEIHKKMMRAMIESRDVEVITSEADITGSDLLHGRVDCIFSFRGDDKMNIVDFKTASNSSFNYIPKRKHEIQVNAYQKFFDIDQGWLLYYNKESQNLEEYYVKRDDERVETNLERLREVKEMYVEGEKPPEPNRDKWTHNYCKYCKFKGTCKYAES